MFLHARGYVRGRPIFINSRGEKAAQAANPKVACGEIIPGKVKSKSRPLYVSQAIPDGKEKSAALSFWSHKTL